MVNSTLCANFTTFAANAATEHGFLYRVAIFISSILANIFLVALAIGFFCVLVYTLITVAVRLVGIPEFYITPRVTKQIPLIDSKTQEMFMLVEITQTVPKTRLYRINV